MAQILVPLHEITIFRILNDNIMAQKVTQKVERIRILGRQNSNPRKILRDSNLDPNPDSNLHALST